MSSEEKSPGQAACEAFWEYMGTGPDGQPPSAAWDWAGSQGARGAWMAASKAATEAAVEAVLALADDWEATAATLDGGTARANALLDCTASFRAAITSALTGEPATPSSPAAAAREGESP
jgi:hypothetical protein